MKLSSIMTGGIETIPPQATLAEAAKKMASQDIGSLPVCAERRRVVGIITDRDITVRAVARGMDPNQTRVEEVMTRDVLSCSSDAEVEHLQKFGADHIVLGEREIAREMASYLVDDGGPEALNETADLAVDGDAFEQAQRVPGKVLSGGGHL